MSLADDYVRDVFEALVAKRDVDAHTNLLAACGEDAVPVLLKELAGTDFARRKVALFGLQYCFSSLARRPVEALLEDRDPRLREMGAMVLSKHYGHAEIARLARKLQHHADPGIAGYALQHLEAQEPDAGRMRKALQDPRIGEWLWKYLPRYQGAEYADGTRALLEYSIAPERCDARVAAGALAGLLAQNDRRPETRACVRALLAHEAPRLREGAAEFLAWHGERADAEALARAAGCERDLHARAAMQAAGASIDRRETFGDTAAFKQFAAVEPSEPYWNYRGKPPEPAFAASRAARQALLARAFALPSQAAGSVAHATEPFKSAVARRLVTPVREYLDPGRTSFALISDSRNTGFRGMIHVGDDVGWFSDYGVVVACADGQVRQACCESTWGWLVVLEHATPGGDRFCSVYAHLSPFLTVRAGDLVQAGQRIGSIGRSFAWENGGYAAHLHFGLHHGPYIQCYKPDAPIDVRFEGYNYTGRVVRSDSENTEAVIITWDGLRHVTQPTSWLRGYVSMKQWNAARHRWLDPQQVLKQYADPESL